MKAVPVNRYLVFFSIAVAGCVIDLASKGWIFSRLDMDSGRTWWFWEEVFGFQLSLNEGALFGIGQGMVVVFSALSVAAALGILFWLFCAGAARDWLLTVALGCVMAGILGNLYDRLGFPGLVWEFTNKLHNAGDPVYAVRDWIKMVIFGFEWANFNIADNLLVCGAAMLVWHAFFVHPKETEKDAGEEAG